MITALIVVGVLVLLALIFVAYSFYKNKGKAKPQIEVKDGNIEVLAKYVLAQKEEAEQKMQLKNLRAAEQKEKLENFRRTKDELRQSLKNQFDAKEWASLGSILRKLDKGTMGIYVLYNETKDKYYVGQSKEVYTRIKKHFEIEPIALDYCNGDVIKVKILSASEMDADYRIDHIEKTGIEIFDANTKGYNKTIGNL